MQYRKKGVVVEAIQYTGTPESICELKAFMGEALDTVTENGLTYYAAKTLEGDMKISTYDYVIREIKGEFYPCKPDVFVATYEEQRDEGLSFGRALELLKQGARVRRAGWNGRGQYVVRMKGYPDGVPANEPTAAAHKIPVGTTITYRPYLVLFSAQGDLVPWAPSVSDALAEDWELSD